MSGVYMAEPYDLNETGSLGRASGMLIRQHNFPHQYDSQLDKITSADHDRCFQWDHAHARRCFTEHTGTGELNLERWVTSQPPDKVIAFLSDILKADAGAFRAWTGFRVLLTVNRSNGFPVYTLELFAKHPDSHTQVYSGENAPNVRKFVPRVGADGRVFVRSGRRW